jgi:hypothetical protein
MVSREGISHADYWLFVLGMFASIFTGASPFFLSIPISLASVVNSYLH